MSQPILFRLMLVFFFLSGATALVYEVVWVRMLSLVFGVAAFAVATVLAAFMGGLGLGAYLFGRWAERLRRPLVAYGILEGAIGVYALLVPALFGALPSVYLHLGRSFARGEHVVLFSAARFLLAAAALVPPTLLMGASLPLLARRFASGARRGEGARVGVLYGVNTLGAVVGTVAAGFLLLPGLGIRGTIHLTAGVNLLLAAAVIAIAGRRSVPDSPATADGLEEGPREKSEARAVPLVLCVFLLCGALSMCYEVYWTRVLVLVIGPSVYAFTLMLTAFLTGLSFGSIAAAPLLRRVRNRLALFGALELFVAVACLLTMLLFSRYPYWFARLSGRFVGRPLLFDGVRFGFSLLTMLLPTLFMGATFPVVAAILFGARGRIARSVGSAYAFNTLGGIAGSFLAGFVLLPLLGVQGGMALFVSLNAAAGFALLAAAGRGRFRRTAIFAGAGALALVLILVMVGGVTVWDEKKMTIGPYQDAIRRIATSRERLDQFLDRFDLLYYAEGVTSTITVRESGGVRTLQTNGKTDASSGADMRTQIAIGQLPMILHGPADRVLVVGLASGVSAAQTLAQGARHVDVVEIEERMIGAARFFAPENRDLLDDPRVAILVEDGRNHLFADTTTYGVIVSQPSNPWISGINNLFTLEAFELMERRLAPGGLVAQWIQYYGMSRGDLFSVLHTFASVFPHVDVFLPARGDLVLIGSRRPIPFDFDATERAVRSPENAKPLEEVSITNAYDLLTMYLFSIDRGEGDRAWEAVRGFPLNRDDNMLLEFSAPRHLEDAGVFENRDALAALHDRSKLHAATGNAHIPLAEGAVRLWDLPVADLELDLEARSEHPDLAGVHNLRSRILLARAGWEKKPELVADAAGEARLALAIDSSSAEAHVLLGTAAMHTGDWGEAERRLHEALRLGADPAVTGVYLGIALERAGRREDAIDAYRSAIVADPALAEAREGLRRLGAGATQTR